MLFMATKKGVTWYPDLTRRLPEVEVHEVCGARRQPWCRISNAGDFFEAKNEVNDI